MTTQITVHAHCGEDKEVEIGIFNITENNEVTIDRRIMQNGEVDRFYVYDNRTVSVREKLKGQP